VRTAPGRRHRAAPKIGSSRRSWGMAHESAGIALQHIVGRGTTTGQAFRKTNASVSRAYATSPRVRILLRIESSARLRIYSAVGAHPSRPGVRVRLPAARGVAAVLPRDQHAERPQDASAHSGIGS
jgi:hypothetical protein